MKLLFSIIIIIVIVIIQYVIRLKKNKKNILKILYLKKITQHFRLALCCSFYSLCMYGSMVCVKIIVGK